MCEVDLLVQYIASSCGMQMQLCNSILLLVHTQFLCTLHFQTMYTALSNAPYSIHTTGLHLNMKFMRLYQTIVGSQANKIQHFDRFVNQKMWIDQVHSSAKNCSNMLTIRFQDTTQVDVVILRIS